jgi:Tfp pilus assembly protein PilP
MTSIVPAIAVVCLLSLPAPIVAQQPPVAPQPPAAPQPVEKGSSKATSGAPAPVAPAGPPYTYDPQGRRDPFVSLLARGSDPGSAANRPSGLPGLLISEVAVKGIVRDRSGLIAMVQGTGTKTFIVRAGEKLMDGSVKAITNDSVVFSQDVNDPLSMVKQKEVRKTVRSADGGRE